MIFETNVLKALYFEPVETKRFQHGGSSWCVQLALPYRGTALEQRRRRAGARALHYGGTTMATMSQPPSSAHGHPRRRRHLGVTRRERKRHYSAVRAIFLTVGVAARHCRPFVAASRLHTATPVLMSVALSWNGWLQTVHVQSQRGAGVARGVGPGYIG